MSSEVDSGIENKVRLNKFIANNGDISRRTADEYIQQGRVTVNNITVDFPSYEVNPDKDKVKVDGEPIKVRTEDVYIALNKPINVVSTVSDENRRTTVIDLVNIKRKIYPIGRLDYKTTGLILLTNDGELADALMHPKHNIDKIYLVKLSKPLEEKHRVLLEKGIMLDGKRTKPAVIKFTSRHGFDKLYITIHEGRNRQVRKMFERFGYFVDKLQRTQFGPIKLGDLEPGKWRYLTPEEVKFLFQKDKPRSAPKNVEKNAEKRIVKNEEKKIDKKRVEKSTVKSTGRRTNKNTSKTPSEKSSKRDSKSFAKSKSKVVSKGKPKSSAKRITKNNTKSTGKFTIKKSNKK